ncbi:hypothetical protein [Streptomyces sp. AK04-3B]|uniref:hypothetical protein n=1 Tax=Streptomyces sp. AK04-3B TaxID=3028650 RepID=UPI0029AE3DCA|nr:hypothetical protein [Streptomyces sp. AK04-3B]MDX3800415.1 hypothetical protein [Streptomyces sp. AK04-3B]
MVAMTGSEVEGLRLGERRFSIGNATLKKPMTDALSVSSGGQALNPARGPCFHL